MAYVKFELEDGTVVYIESTDTPKGSSGLIPSGRGGEHADQPAVSFEQSVQAVRKMAGALMTGLRDGLAEQPDDVSISFGLKASGDLGCLVVGRGGMEANYNVSLRWHKEDKKDEKKNGDGEEKKEDKE